ncbi:AMP-binding protein [Chitinophaga polysaccharea]|uniref:AMP-binding protein n=1 Tax=Chitinophaga polysaccharea TaxID=1293035 RepID=UPI00115BBCC3|nr:AMP-binding protein [Chitinophaga polysaccharea]
MKLYDLIRGNDKLGFIDALSGKRYPAGSFHRSLEIDDHRGIVFIYCDNLVGSVEVLLNFLDSRFAVTLLSAQLNSSFKEDLENRYRPYYIYDPVRTDISGFELFRAGENIRLFRSRQRTLYPVHADIKLLLSTSGSTGSPKFVKLSDDNLVHNARSILDYMPIRPHDTVPLNVPIIFVYGFSIFTTNCIAGGNILCTSHDVLKKEFWDDFHKYQCATIGGVPYVYEMLQRIGFFRKNCSSLRYMTQTGGILNHTLTKTIAGYCATWNKQFYMQYGQTEASGRMAYLDPADILKKESSIGFPVKGGRFEIDDATGELIYYGKNVFGGYATNYQDLNEYQHTNKLYTGDVARKDEEGYYFITGRIKRIMKLYGTRMNLDEVELILKNALGGQTFVCFGLEDKYLAILHLNDELPEDAIKQVLKEKMGLHPGSLRVKYVHALPLTPNGKVDYAAVTDLV